MRKRMILALAVVLGLVLALYAPLAPVVAEEDVVVINFPSFQVGVNTAAPVLARNVERFNEEYAGKYEIVVEEIPGDQNYIEKMQHMLSQDDLPPVVYGGGYNLLDPALDRDLVVDLTEHVEADPDWQALYNDASMNVNSRDGKIYASSSEGNVIGYFYNKEIFKEAGIEGPAETWDELWEQADILVEHGVQPFAMDTADSAWVTSLWLGAMVGSASEEAYEWMQVMMPNDYQFPEFIEGLTNIQKMFVNYSTVDAVGGKYENAANNFINGQVAMMANGPWMINDFSDESFAPEGFADKVGVALYPDNFVYNEPIQGMFVTKQDDPRLEEAAIEMVRFFTSAESQTIALEMQGMIPAGASVEITEAAEESFPLLAEFIALLPEAEFNSANLQATMYPNLLDVVSQEFPRLAQEEITPEEMAEILTTEAMKNE